ncbi:hypothetical protein C8R42DRAFT_774151 [Lentinula raphanica]|nr:hypothetical protein C8R42DRAFT_774151 [Lentinula raphanica]
MVNFFARLKVSRKSSKKNDTTAAESYREALSTNEQSSSVQLSKLGFTQAPPLQFEAWQGLSHTPKTALHFKSCRPTQSTQAHVVKPRSWLKRAVTSVDTASQDGPNLQEQYTSHTLESPSFEEYLKVPIYRVEAWRQMPTYFSGATLISASEGEIVDPFRREIPTPHTTRSLPDSWPDSSFNSGTL